MFAVSISLGFSSCYVAVSPISTAGIAQDLTFPSINIVANSAGHRNTPPACAFTDTAEILFGDTAHHSYGRLPGSVIPSIFAYAAVENVLRSSLDENSAAEAEEFHETIMRSTSVKYKGHSSLLIEERKKTGFTHEYTDDRGNDLARLIGATDLFVKLLNHIKEHSVDGPCGINTTENATNKIFLTMVAPRYAFPRAKGECDTNGKAPWSWLENAVEQSKFSDVVAHVKFLFSDEAAILGLDFLGRAYPSYQPLLVPPSRFASDECALPTDVSERILVADWGAQGLHFTLLKAQDGILVNENGRYPPFSSTVLQSDVPPCGGDALDLVLADRVAANFILQQRRIFQSKIPQFMSSMQPRKETLGKVNPIVQEHIPSRAMRQLRLKIEEKKSSLLSNQQVAAVTVEAEAFYEGMDLLDNQTLSRRRLEMALESEWGLADLFRAQLLRFLQQQDVTEELNGGRISRVIVCGGMFQIPFLCSVIEKSIQVWSSTPSFSKEVQVMTVWKTGSASADEVFAIGGCLQSFYSGTLYNSMNRAQLALKGGKTKNKRLEAIRKAAVSGYQNAWKILGGATGKSAKQAESGTLTADCLLHGIYLYTSPELSLLTEQGTDANGTISLPPAVLTPIFPKMSILPKRVVVQWPKNDGTEGDAAVLYLFSDITGMQEEGVRYKPLLERGVVLTRPLKCMEGHSTYIVFTACSNAGKPVMRIQVTNAKGDDGLQVALLKSRNPTVDITL